MPIKHRPIFAAMLALALLGASPAHADRDDHHDQGHHEGWNGHDNGKNHGHQDRDNHRAVIVRHNHPVFRNEDRIVITNYYHRAMFPACPPGLAHRHGGCVPYHHVRRFIIGQPLPPEVIYQPVPAALIVNLQPPPPGYVYADVDGNILLIAAGTRIVIDAVPLFSAVQ